MISSSDSLWNTDATRQFADTLATIDDPLTIRRFLRDVMTEKEITEISSRLEAARLLQAGATYIEVIEKTKLSSRTIARINNWMKNGKGGYTAALKILKAHHDHLSPARAE